jgi:hypothetical protein
VADQNGWSACLHPAGVFAGNFIDQPQSAERAPHLAGCRPSRRNWRSSRGSDNGVIAGAGLNCFLGARQSYAASVAAAKVLWRLPMGGLEVHEIAILAVEGGDRLA